VNTKPPPERESKIQKSIIVRLERLGITLWRRNVVGYKIDDRFVRCGKVGQADLWGIDWVEPGGVWARHWEIETKRPGNRPTPAQLEWLKAMSANGCIAYWADSANIAERVAEAIIAGGRIVWLDDDNFDVEIQ
jgi:hypothetical protein